MQNREKGLTNEFWKRIIIRMTFKEAGGYKNE